MAEPSDIEIKTYLKWSTILPIRSVLSPAFEVQGLECRLQITKLDEDWMCGFEDRYSVEVKLSENSNPFRFLILKTAAVQCDENFFPFSLDSFKPVKWHSGEKNHVFNDRQGTRVTFIIHFDSDVKSKSGISEADKKLVEKASEPPIQIPCLKALSGDLGKLLEEESNHDVVLKCRDRIVKAHKIVLMSRSKVFEGMLQSDMVEGQTGHVQIKDMDAEVFQDLVRYLYTGVASELNEDKAKRLYEAGDLYAVESLMQRCSTFLTENLTDENACGILDIAETHSDSEFKERVIAYILKKKIPLMDEVWKPFSARSPLVAVDVLNRFIRLRVTT